MSADHRRCSICGTGVAAGVLCVDHTQLAHLAAEIALNLRSDWPILPKKPTATIDGDVSDDTPTQPTHREFMTGAFTTHSAYTWRAQLATVLAQLDVWLDDSGRE